MVPELNTRVRSASVLRRCGSDSLPWCCRWSRYRRLASRRTPSVFFTSLARLAENLMVGASQSLVNIDTIRPWPRWWCHGRSASHKGAGCAWPSEPGATDRRRGGDPGHTGHVICTHHLLFRQIHTQFAGEGLDDVRDSPLFLLGHKQFSRL